jgi:hypothetical protein
VEAKKSAEENAEMERDKKARTKWEKGLFFFLLF